MTTAPKPQHPETEAAQEVHGPVKDQQEHRDRQAAQLYRHACKLEAERDRLRAVNAELVKALQCALDALERDVSHAPLKPEYAKAAQGWMRGLFADTARAALARAKE